MDGQRLRLLRTLNPMRADIADKRTVIRHNARQPRQLSGLMQDANAQDRVNTGFSHGFVPQDRAIAHKMFGGGVRPCMFDRGRSLRPAKSPVNQLNLVKTADFDMLAPLYGRFGGSDSKSVSNHNTDWRAHARRMRVRCGGRARARNSAWRYPRYNSA